jgi:protein-S-isoprenylcysteine O-methyltransferase Ste14
MASQPKGAGDTPSTPNKEPFNMLRRGIKKSNPAGALTFIGLRAVDPALQYAILARGIGSSLLQKLGLETLPAGPPNTGTLFDALGLSPYRLVLFGMAVGSSVKQIYWLLSLSEEEMVPSTAAAVAAFNTVVNSMNNLLFTCSLTSASLSSGGVFPQTPFLVGSALYVAGILLETASEVERKQFKKDPRNKGRVYSEGLWALARHINYTGYTIWRVGYALVGGGWIWAGFMLGYQIQYFLNNAIPSIDGYCSQNVSQLLSNASHGGPSTDQLQYGEQWEEYKRKVPYQLLPYIY